MAVLSDPDRVALWAEFMRDAARCPGSITKAQLRAAVDAADDWAETNAASFNSAIPTAARNAMTAKQKAALLMFVMERRYGVL